MTNAPDDQQPPDGVPYPPPGQPGYYAPAAHMPSAPDHPRATTALVLGILGIVACGVLAPFAWSIGKRAMTEIDASQGQLGGRGAANAGYILGVVGSILLGLAVLLLVLVFGLSVLGLAVGFSTAP